LSPDFRRFGGIPKELVMSRKYAFVAVALLAALALTPFLFANVDAHPNGPSSSPVAQAAGNLSPDFPGAIATDTNNEVILSVSQPVAVPHAVLNPGTYTVRFVDQDMDTVLIRNAGGDAVAICDVIPAERDHATGGVAINVAHVENGQSRVVSWFLPGTTDGWQFVYPRNGKRAAMAQSSAGAAHGE
jgi:hypothetical protein